MSLSLADEVAFSPATFADAEGVAELIRALERSLGYRPAVSAAELRFFFSQVDLKTCSWLVRHDGNLVAAAWLDQHGDTGWITGAVSPSARGRGLGTRLLDAAESRGRELGLATFRVVAYAAELAAHELLGARGYLCRRRFATMAIELDRPPPLPRWPDGIELSAFEDEHARAFHAALNEAFVNDWAFVSLPFADWYRLRVGEDDTSLYFFAREGSEIAGVIRCESEHRGAGWVGALGVRPAWRGRGIGRALLLHAFGVFHGRGQSRVGLEVDSANPALRLYQDVGMEVEFETVVYDRAAG
jgi:mycothiol synthase